MKTRLKLTTLKESRVIAGYTVQQSECHVTPGYRVRLPITWEEYVKNFRTKKRFS